MKTIKLTRENLHALSASPGKAGFTLKQLELLGVAWPPRKGWLSALIGSEIPLDTYNAVKLVCRKKWLTPEVKSQVSGQLGLSL